MEYRKALTLDPETSYVYVNLGWLDELNGSCRYPFPTPEAAELFADRHKIRDPQREISITYPDGAVWPL